MSSEERIVRVAQVIRPATGGMRSHLTTLLSGLDQERYRPTLFAPEDFTLADASLSIERVSLRIGTKTRPLADLQAISYLAQELHGNFDIIHAHGLRGALIGVLAASRAGVPSLFTAHNLVPPLGLLPRFFLRAVSRRAAVVIAVSVAVAKTLRAAGAPEEQIVVIPNGIDIRAFDIPPDTAATRAQYGLPADAPLLVAIGRFAPEKGFDVLLEAFRRVQERCPKARLVLAGSGSLEASLKELAQNSSPNAIYFTGHIPNVVALLQAADVVAIPSREEGQGLVALEAMAARKPVVATQVGGLVETILPGETGLLVPSADPIALANALLQLLDDTALRQTMGEAGHRRVEQEYTAEKMVARIETLYSRYAR